MAGNGFDGWIEIFKGGTQIDSKGRTHDGDAMIDQAVDNFDINYHEPPLVAGHPKDNAPAFGWVSDLKTEAKSGGKTLLAKFKDVVPEFEEAVKNGLYKKRSAAFYKDGRLRHVGFLGGKPPAVKGLSDIAFGDDDQVATFEFAETSPWTWGAIGSVFRKIKDWIIEKEGRETADAIIPEWHLDDLTAEKQRAQNDSGKGEENMKFSDFMEVFKFWKKVSEDPDAVLPDTGGAASFSEADVEAAKKAAAKKAKKKAEAEFAEKEKAAAKTARDASIAAFCEGLVKDGAIPPAWVDGGLVTFMQGLDADESVSFAEDVDKQTPLEYFKSFLEGFGKSTIFKELATKEAAGKHASFAEAEADSKLGESIAETVT